MEEAIMCDAAATTPQSASQQQARPCKRECEFDERNGVVPACGRKMMCAAWILMQQRVTEMADPS